MAGMHSLNIIERMIWAGNANLPSTEWEGSVWEGPFAYAIVEFDEGLRAAIEEVQGSLRAVIEEVREEVRGELEDVEEFQLRAWVLLREDGYGFAYVDQFDTRAEALAFVREYIIELEEAE